MGFETIPSGKTIRTGSSWGDWSKLSWSAKQSVNGIGTSTYRGGVYCGPKWGFTYKDILDGRIRDLPTAVDAIDEACKLHDYCYEENGYFTQGCNLVLTVDLVKVAIGKDSTPQQRLDAVLMAAVFFVESQTIDVGVLAKNQIAEMRDRLMGRISQMGMTLEQAITREVLGRSMPPFP